MKIFCLIALLAVAGGFNLSAQTGSAAAPHAPTRIDSDSVDFDLNTHQAVYHGDVHVDDPQMKLTCTHLVVFLPESGGRPDRIVAETNVVIDFTDEKSQKVHATSDKAIYIYKIQNGGTNETVTLTGHAKAKLPQYALTGEPIIWDRTHNQIYANNESGFINPSTNEAAGNTNPPAVK